MWSHSLISGSLSTGSHWSVYAITHNKYRSSFTLAGTGIRVSGEASTSGSDGARNVLFRRSKDLRLIDLSLTGSMMDGHSQDGIKKMDVIALLEHLRHPEHQTVLPFESAVT